MVDVCSKNNIRYNSPFSIFKLLENVIANEFIASFVGSSATPNERRRLALPVSYGDLGQSGGTPTQFK